MHIAVEEFLTKVKEKYPLYFKEKDVLEVGSLDINWSVRKYFDNCTYTWIDLWEGKWVDLVRDIIDYNPIHQFDVVISTEMLEHCINYQDAIFKMVDLLKSWWLLIVTAWGSGRTPHWTFESDPMSAPFTNDWYKNILASEFALVSDSYFNEYEISYIPYDIRFIWIKK
jgi:hypothetical protein